LRPIRSAITSALASALVAATLTGCQFGSDEQSGGDIVIAADLELSGSNATVGKSYQRALELKVEQVNESGVLGGRQLQIRIKDNRSDPSESLRNVGEFADSRDVHAVIMGSCNECAVGAVRSVNEKGLPAIALATSSEVAAPAAERRYMFKLGPNARDNAAALAAELKRQKVTHAGLLYSDDAYGKEGLEALTGELEKADIRLSRSQRVRPGDAEGSVQQAMSSLIATISSGGGYDPLGMPLPNNAARSAIIVWTPTEQAVLAAARAQQARYPGKVVFDAAAAGSLFFTDPDGRTIDDALMVFTQTMVIDDVIATTPAKAARKKWFRDYTARYGGYYGFSSFAADAVELIVDAALRAERMSGDRREAIRSVLETSQFDGVSGPIRMTPDNHSGLMPQALTMLVSRDGRWRLAS
jgi:branched-chain amino acid transport system substrate-binding protein